MELREITYLAVALRIFAAIILGGLIGLERGLKNRAAGLRTHMLVCVGACLIMVTNQFIYQTTGTGDPVRMGAQVISGIGFLGAGTIMVTRRHQVKGLTTAAGLWTAAGVGLTLGIGFYEAAAMGSLAVFIVMTLMQKMDNRVHRKTKDFDLFVELTPTLSFGNFLKEMRKLEIEVAEVQKEPSTDAESGNRAYLLAMHTKDRRLHMDVLEEIQAIEGVSYTEII
jgi:putative Mg2+ transporter-C (MgtC) family protein